MNEDDWEQLLLYIAKEIVGAAEEELDGDPPTVQQILTRLNEYRADIDDVDGYKANVKTALVDYASHYARTYRNEA